AARDTAYGSARSVRTAPRSARCRSSRSATLTATGYPTSSAASTACEGATIRDGTTEIPYEVSRSGPSTVDSRGRVPVGERRQAGTPDHGQSRRATRGGRERAERGRIGHDADPVAGRKWLVGKEKTDVEQLGHSIDADHSVERQRRRGHRDDRRVPPQPPGQPG